MATDPFLPFVEVPTTRDKPDFPLTRLICDLLRDRNQARANWKAGKHPSISPDRAKWYAEVTR